jgi:hypothetical protein
MILVSLAQLARSFELLAKVFTKVLNQWNNFNPKKCAFYVNFVVLSGHIVYNEGLLIDPIKAIITTNMSTPTNVTEIKHFLGGAISYWRYFKDFASKTRPMCKLFKKDGMLKWMEACAKALEWMKSSMTCLPIVIVIEKWNFKGILMFPTLFLGLCLSKIKKTLLIVSYIKQVD